MATVATSRPGRAARRTIAQLQRALCVLASYEQDQRADEPSLWPSYLPVHGVERVTIAYDPLSDTDTDGDGDPHTTRSFDVEARRDAVLPEIDDMVRAMAHCTNDATSITCTSDTRAFKFAFQHQEGGEYVVVRQLEVTPEKPPMRGQRRSACTHDLSMRFGYVRRARRVATVVMTAARPADAQVFRPHLGKVMIANPAAVKQVEHSAIVVAMRPTGATPARPWCSRARLPRWQPRPRPSRPSRPLRLAPPGRGPITQPRASSVDRISTTPPTPVATRRTAHRQPHADDATVTVEDDDAPKPKPKKAKKVKKAKANSDDDGGDVVIVEDE